MKASELSCLTGSIEHEQGKGMRSPHLRMARMSMEKWERCLPGIIGRMGYIFHRYVQILPDEPGPPSSFITATWWLMATQRAYFTIHRHPIRN